MKQMLIKLFTTSLMLVAPVGIVVAAGGGHYEKIALDIRNQESVQRGAQIFTNYCLSCHSASAMRFNRLKDIGLTEEEIKNNLMFTTDKLGSVMKSAMNPKDGVKWFGAAPPDLSLIARSRGADYLYAYMRGFYKDPTRPTGWNNKVLPNAAMPHPLWQQQGVQAVELDDKGNPVMVTDGHGYLVPKLYWEATGFQTRRLPNGKVITKEYDDYVRDLVNFMVYISEPVRLQRERIGYVVLLFLIAIMLPLAYLLKKEYWKDVH